jgi:hypothetical protein
MGEKSQFKLIGVRPLKGCAPHIRKVLKEDTTYFIYNEYEIDPETPELIRERKGVDPIHKTFFSDGVNSPLISISAIVGKNGDGKSTLIEIIIRIINNFAYASGYQSKHEDLRPIEGLNAILYFTIEEYSRCFKEHTLYFIKSELKNGEYHISTNFLNKELDINHPENDIHEFINSHENNEEVEKILFYTQISNYSLYAYNALELQHENMKDDNYCWINGIFHKNDSYQTPIVLNPWRNNGNIEVNNENYLAQQRLLSLYVRDSKIRVMNDKQVAVSMIFRKEESKLILNSYRRYFQQFMSVKVNLLQSEITDLEYYSKVELISQTHLERLLEDHVNGVSNIKSIIEKYTTDFNQALEIAVSLEDKLEKDVIEYKSDFSSYLDQLKNALQKYINNNYSSDNIKIEEAIQTINFFQTEIIKGHSYSFLNINILQRVIVVISIRELWMEELNQDWNIQNFYGDNSNSLAQQYIVYKTISIFQKYDPYKRLESISLLDRYNSLFDFSKVKTTYIENNSSCFRDLITDIKDHKSHVTLKLRQTLGYLLFNESYKYIKSKDKNQVKIENLKLSNKTYIEGSYLIDLDVYNNRTKNLISAEMNGELDEKWNLLTVDQLLIPGFFKTDIVFQDLKNKQEYFLFSELSSGERQLLHNVSSVVYHLKNIDSVSSDKGKLKYSHINIIFEEIELYFHPEYQRKYINYLLDLISKANLKEIESINMCFVTHSPFILSDIPKNNVLFLQDGISTRQMQEDTFGGNIHTLLQNGFFLNSVPIGEFAKEKINKLFERLHAGETTISDTDKTDMYNHILLVSEPFIKSQLFKLYHESNLKNQGLLDLKLEIEKLKEDVKLLKGIKA